MEFQSRRQRPEPGTQAHHLWARVCLFYGALLCRPAADWDYLHRPGSILFLIIPHLVPSTIVCTPLCILCHLNISPVFLYPSSIVTQLSRPILITTPFLFSHCSELRDVRL